MLSGYLSRTLSLRKRKRLITQIAAAAGRRLRLAAHLGAAEAATDSGANFCDAFGGDILQPALPLEQISLPLSPSLP